MGHDFLGCIVLISPEKLLELAAVIRVGNFCISEGYGKFRFGLRVPNNMRNPCRDCSPGSSA